MVAETLGCNGVALVAEALSEIEEFLLLPLFGFDFPDGRGSVTYVPGWTLGATELCDLTNPDREEGNFAMTYRRCFLIGQSITLVLRPWGT